jgi:hypothetical protein
MESDLKQNVVSMLPQSFAGKKGRGQIPAFILKSINQN